MSLKMMKNNTIYPIQTKETQVSKKDEIKYSIFYIRNNEIKSVKPSKISLYELKYQDKSK